MLESERGVSSTAGDFPSVLAASISSSPGLLLLIVLLSLCHCLERAVAPAMSKHFHLCCVIENPQQSHKVASGIIITLGNET